MNISPLKSVDPMLMVNQAGLPFEQTAAQRPTPEQVTKAAGQFEAILVRQLLAPAIEPLMSGEGGTGGGVYSYMLTDTLASAITKGGGLGFSEMIRSQLGDDSADTQPPAL